MKKLLIIYMLITINFLISTPHKYAIASNKYARIESTTQIYKTTSGNDTIDNIYCLAEESYFVEIIGDYEEYYRVYYNGINGYIKKYDVKEITNTPSTPYPYNIKIVIGTNCNLRSSPTTKSSTNNVITTLYSKEKEITFIGRTFGEEAIDFGGSTWYYVCYNGNYGYIYNNYVQSITPIYANNEGYTYTTIDQTKIENPITNTPSLIIIIVLALPLFGILFLLYLPKKSQNKTKRPKTPKVIEKY